LSALQNIIPEITTTGSVSPSIPEPDTILLSDTAIEAQKKNTESRFFTSQRDEPVSFNPEPLPQPQNEWQVMALSVSLVLIAFVRLSGKNFFRNLYSGLISRPIFRQMLRDGQLIPQIGKLPLLLSFLLVVTVFIFQIDNRFSWLNLPESDERFRTGLAVFAVIGLFEISRYIIMHLLGFIFKTRWIVKEFITNNIFFHTISTLLVMPLLLLSIYARTEIILLAAAGVLAILFIFRLIRALIISFELRSYSGYQIFLYLCALEILPVFILIKILTGYISRI
jgi:hypothetical protein